MLDITDERFEELIDEAFDSMPKNHRDHVKNVALVYADEPTPEQRIKLELRDDQTLLGLYEGIPLSQRQGETALMPDKITLFKWPLLSMVNTEDELKEEVRHTLWHEIAHYYGLDHDQIRALE
jgi:predicted Zn-dependent protease with MMP-like domain